MKYLASFLFCVCSVFGSLANATSGHISGHLSGPILILTCDLDRIVDGITKMRVYGDPETWPGLSSGARVSAEGVTEEIERNGKVHSFYGTFMSDSLGITGNFSMMGVTYMIFDFNQNQSRQHLKVVNRWQGDFNDFEMDCIHF